MPGRLELPLANSRLAHAVGRRDTASVMRVWALGVWLEDRQPVGGRGTIVGLLRARGTCSRTTSFSRGFGLELRARRGRR